VPLQSRLPALGLVVSGIEAQLRRLPVAGHESLQVRLAPCGRLIVEHLLDCFFFVHLAGSMNLDEDKAGSNRVHGYKPSVKRFKPAGERSEPAGLRAPRRFASLIRGLAKIYLSSSTSGVPSGFSSSRWIVLASSSTSNSSSWSFGALAGSWAGGGGGGT